MAKETMIIFVYDMEYCKSEEDDPASAILYFHPNWVSDQQRTSLCGQIMGTTHFLSSVFACPKVLALQSGKFVIKQFHRYILAVGTDRNIDDWILEYRADVITSLIRFFHSDLHLVCEQSVNHSNFSDKLYTMFETYLKILQYNNSIFTNIPLLQLPKSANVVFLEAMEIMNQCQDMKMVLGGTVLFNNKVLATQLSCTLTKLLVMSDPFRIKSAADIPSVNYNIPLGVQLFYVYINTREYKSLQERTLNLQTMSNANFKKPKKIPNNKPKEPVLSAMKRDQSLIFTTVPEEELDHHHSSQSTEQIKPDRPKSLNLRSVSYESKVANNSNEKLTGVPSTPFTGKVSICSTPVAEKFLHGAPLSVCCDFETDVLNDVVETIEPEQKKESVMPIVPVSMKCYSFGLPNLKKVLDDTSIKTENKTDDFIIPKYLNKTITDPLYPVFHPDGTPMSKFMYDFCIQNNCDLLNEQLTTTLEQSVTNTDDWKSLSEFDSDLKQPISQLCDTNKSLKDETTKNKSKEARRSLSLPLKSLSFDQNESTSLTQKRGGVQLTPLMNKLSILAMEEKSSGFCSRDTTPSEFRNFGLTPNEKPYSFLERKNSTQVDEVEESLTEELQKVVLFICSQQDMVLELLLEEDAVNNSDLIQKLWEICTETMSHLESQLRHCLDPYPVANADQGEAYSYLRMDEQWNTTQRGGPWGVSESDTLTQLHRDFVHQKNITEITLRCEDGIIYGYRCGKAEVYYHQTSSTNAGLPPPADLMGVVPLKARRKLERDHAIILL